MKKSIWKKYKDANADWFEIDEIDFIHDTEEMGHWQKDSALDIIQTSGKIFTPYAIYRYTTPDKLR